MGQTSQTANLKTNRKFENSIQIHVCGCISEYPPEQTDSQYKQQLNIWGKLNIFCGGYKSQNWEEGGVKWVLGGSLGGHNIRPWGGGMGGINLIFGWGA